MKPRHIAAALLAVAIATGCSTDRVLYQDEWPDPVEIEPTMGTRGAMCGWHTPEAHENALSKGYVLECEERAK